MLKNIKTWLFSLCFILFAITSVYSLELTKTFTDDPAVPNGSVTLEFTINNTDDVAVTDIAFTDDLDATLSGLVAVGLPMNDVCGAGSHLSGTSVLTLTGGDLPPNGICTFSVMLQVPAGARQGTYPNATSSLTSSLGSSGMASDVLYVEAPTGTITVHKFNDLDGDGNLDAGEPGISGWSISLYSGSGCNRDSLFFLGTVLFLSLGTVHLLFFFCI
jgi:hypothetical protein